MHNSGGIRVWSESAFFSEYPAVGVHLLLLEGYG